MHQMYSKGYTNGGYCHNLNICKVFRFLVNSSSSPGPAFQILSTCLFDQPLQPNSKNQMWPILFCSSPASPFPACNARVVFKTNENGTQEAKWIHLALCSPLPCCYLFLCISLEATFVNMAAEKPQARENCFLYKTNNVSSAGVVLNKAAIWTATKCKMVSPCVGRSSCFDTRRNKYFKGGKAKLAIYREISRISITWSSNSKTGMVYS